MALNLSYLATIEPYESNLSMFDNKEEIATNLVSTAQSSTGDWYLFGILLVVYIVGMAITTNKEGIFRLDFISANLMLSGFCLIISGVGLVLGFTNSFNDVSFFGTLFFVSVVGKLLNNAKS